MVDADSVSGFAKGRSETRRTPGDQERANRIPEHEAATITNVGFCEQTSDFATGLQSLYSTRAVEMVRLLDRDREIFESALSPHFHHKEGAYARAPLTGRFGV